MTTDPYAKRPDESDDEYIARCVAQAQSDVGDPFDSLGTLAKGLEERAGFKRHEVLIIVAVYLAHMSLSIPEEG